MTWTFQSDTSVRAVQRPPAGQFPSDPFDAEQVPLPRGQRWWLWNRGQ